MSECQHIRSIASNGKRGPASSHGTVFQAAGSTSEEMREEHYSTDYQQAR